MTRRTSREVAAQRRLLQDSPEGGLPRSEIAVVDGVGRVS